jgi:hypothetical protein
MSLSNSRPSSVPMNAVSSTDPRQHPQFTTLSQPLQPSLIISHATPMISSPSSNSFSQMKNIGDFSSDDWTSFDKHPHFLVSEEEERERQREDLGFGVEALEGMLKITEDALKVKTLWRRN